MADSQFDIELKDLGKMIFDNYRERSYVGRDWIWDEMREEAKPHIEMLIKLAERAGYEIKKS